MLALISEASRGSTNRERGRKCRKAKQYATAISPPLAIGKRPRLADTPKYATAISPLAKNDATLVNKPSATNKPQLNSIQPVTSPSVFVGLAENRGSWSRHERQTIAQSRRAKCNAPVSAAIQPIPLHLDSLGKESFALYEVFATAQHSTNASPARDNSQLSRPLSAPMKCPEKVAGHDVGDNGEQHQENGDPENPTVMHSPPTRSTFAVMLVTVLIVHTKQKKHITDTRLLGKEKGPSRTGGSKPDRRFHDRLAFPYPVNSVEPATGGTFRCLILCSIYTWSSLVRPF
jgi:hypothetical protein